VRFPDQAAVYTRFETIYSTKTRVYSSEYEVERSFAATLGISADIGWASGSLAASYLGSRKASGSGSKTFALTFCARKVLDFEHLDDEASPHEPWKLTTQRFQKALEALPDRFNANNAARFTGFFDLYGTHYVKRGTLGGLVYVETFIAEEALEKIGKDKIEAELTAGVNAVAGRGQVTAKGMYDSSELLKTYENQVEITVRTLGGTGIDPGSTLSGLAQWADGVTVQPVLLLPIEQLAGQCELELRPIWDLVSPELDSAKGTARSLKAALSTYLGTKPQASEFLGSRLTGKPHVVYNIPEQSMPGFTTFGAVASAPGVVEYLSDPLSDAPATVRARAHAIGDSLALLGFTQTVTVPTFTRGAFLVGGGNAASSATVSHVAYGLKVTNPSGAAPFDVYWSYPRGADPRTSVEWHRFRVKLGGKELNGTACRLPEVISHLPEGFVMIEGNNSDQVVKTGYVIAGAGEHQGWPTEYRAMCQAPGAVGAMLHETALPSFSLLVPRTKNECCWIGFVAIDGRGRDDQWPQTIAFRATVYPLDMTMTLRRGHAISPQTIYTASQDGFVIAHLVHEPGELPSNNKPSYTKLSVDIGDSTDQLSSMASVSVSSIRTTRSSPSLHLAHNNLVQPVREGRKYRLTLAHSSTESVGPPATIRAQWLALVARA
jgi:hypothetical protein